MRRPPEPLFRAPTPCVRRPRRRRWLLSGLRYGLCGVAIWYLAHLVNWHTQIRLGDDKGPYVRLVEQKAEGYVIEQNGRQEFVPLSAVHCVEIEGKLTPDVQTGIRDVLHEMNGLWALYAILLFAPVWFLQSYRLVLMVAIQGVKLSYWERRQADLRRQFSLISRCPVRPAATSSKPTTSPNTRTWKTEVVTTVFLDRAIGLLGLVILAAGGILLKWDPNSFRELAVVLALMFLGFGGRFAWWSSAPGSVACCACTSSPPDCPQARSLLRVGRATVAMRAHKVKTALSMLVTILLQGQCMVSAAVMGWALGMQGPGGAVSQLWYFAIYVSIGFLIAAIPLTPQSIGVMETAYVKFFTAHGLNTASQALAFALAVRLIQLVWAVPGVLVPLLGAHLPRKEEMADLVDAAPAK